MTAVDPMAQVDPSAHIGDDTRIWALAQVREGATIGRECVVGRGAYVDRDVRIGDRVKIQNLAQIFSPAKIEDGVFVGPGVILTNDQYPRAVTPDGEVATAADWSPVGVVVREGASIGARAVCVAPVVIGRWSMVAAGATVVHDVPAFALVAGAPARTVAWIGKAGRRLTEEGDGFWVCPISGDRYRLRDETLVEERS